MNGQKKKILFISLYTEMGGGEYGLYYLLKHLDRNQYQPILMSCKPGPLLDRVGALGIETVVVPFHVVILKHLVRPAIFWVNLQFSFEIKDYIRRQEINIIQCSDVLTLLLLLPATLSRRIPIVYSVTFIYEWSRAILLNMLAILAVNQIMVLSELVNKDLQRKTIGLKKRTRLIYWGVDTERFYQRPKAEVLGLRERLGLPANSRIVGFIGRYDTWKGHLTFLSAAERVARMAEDIIFLMVGGEMTGHIIPEVARYRQMVDAKVAAAKMSERLIVWGHRDDIPEIMSVLDVFVCPSDFEPFGLVVLEGAACGVPVVVSSSVGALEALAGIDGVFVAEPGNAESFKDKISEALMYTRKSAAREFHGGGAFTWESCARKYEAAYSQITGKAA